MAKENEKIESKVLMMAEPICAANSAEIVDVEWQKEGADWVLRLFVDRSSGVDHDLCVAVSRAIGEALDEADFIEPVYTLEVSSPGVERPLKKAKDFQRFAGEYAAIRLFKAVDKKKEIVGFLGGYSEEGVKITDEKSKKEYTFKMEEIAKANLRFKF